MMLIATFCHVCRSGGECRGGPSRGLCRSVETRWLPHYQGGAGDIGAVSVRRGLPLWPLFEPSEESVRYPHEHGMLFFFVLLLWFCIYFLQMVCMCVALIKVIIVC